MEPVIILVDARCMFQGVFSEMEGAKERLATMKGGNIQYQEIAINVLQAICEDGAVFRLEIHTPI